jgi:hypothetical protein
MMAVSLKISLSLGLLFWGSNTFASNRICQYEKKNCPTDFYCIHFEKDKDVCLASFVKERLIVDYPFDKKIKSICDQGNLSIKDNSHTWSNTAFALDLQGDRSKKDNLIHAGADGVVISFDECKTKNDSCGLGFGNQVKVLTENNFILFYAHLEKVKVKTGDKVKKGDVIGIEGDTGQTGENNRHLHISVHHDWKTEGFEYWKKTGYLPQSVPFIFSDISGNQLKSENVICVR